MISGSSFFQVYLSCLANLDHSIQYIVYLTFYIHYGPTHDPAATADVEANNQLYKGFKSPTNGVLPLAQSGSLEPLCDKHSLTKTANLLGK